LGRMCGKISIFVIVSSWLLSSSNSKLQRHTVYCTASAVVGGSQKMR